MRKTIALVMALSILGASPPVNQPARATAVEYAVMLALIIVVCITDVKESNLPPDQKAHLIGTLESWKSLPPTKKNVDYVKRNSSQIKKLLTTANSPSSQAALRKYMGKVVKGEHFKEVIITTRSQSNQSKLQNNQIKLNASPQGGLLTNSTGAGVVAPSTTGRRIPETKLQFR